MKVIHFENMEINIIMTSKSIVGNTMSISPSTYKKTLCPIIQSLVSNFVNCYICVQ